MTSIFVLHVLKLGGTFVKIVCLDLLYIVLSKVISVCIFILLILHWNTVFDTAQILTKLHMLYLDSSLFKMELSTFFLYSFLIKILFLYCIDMFFLISVLHQLSTAPCIKGCICYVSFIIYMQNAQVNSLILYSLIFFVRHPDLC